MKLLSRLFRKAPPAPVTLQDRLATLDAGNPETLAAIERLPYGNELLQLAGLHESQTNEIPAETRRAAQQRLASLIDASNLNLTTLSAGATNKPALLAVAGFCQSPDKLQQVFATLDAAEFPQLAAEGASTRIRQMAAEAMTDPAQLRQLLKDLRGKDKAVYRIVKQKCDDLLAQERAAAQTQLEIEALCASLERHSARPYDERFVGALESLNTRWQVVAEQATPPLRNRARAAIDRGRETIAAHVQAMAADAARAGAIANAQAQRLEVVEDLRNVLTALYGVEDAADATWRPALAQQLARAAERWTQADEYGVATNDLTKQYHQLRDALGELRQLIDQHGTPTQQAQAFAQADPEADLGVQKRALKQTLAALRLLPESTPAATAASEALQAWDQARNDKRAAEALALRQAGGLIRKAEGALRDGHSGRAAGMRRAIEEKLADLPAVPAALQGQLQKLDEKLGLLKDWKNYAVAPKRIELIEEMESLLSWSGDPQQLADRIKELQAQWKTISKGVASDDDAEWQRFHQAAQTAYQPCREYFDAQAKLREENLNKRADLRVRLANFESAQNWEQPDWPLVAQVLREARQEWRRASPVERGAGKEVQAQFDALLDGLQARLDGEYAANAKARKALIARAKRLLTAEDGRQAIDDIKQLQQDWKSIGPVPRDEDRKLWEEFRQHCDAVFQKRQQQFADQNAALDATRAQAAGLSESVEAIAALSGAELLQRVAELPALREAFEALGELPRAHARDLTRRFDRALKQCDAALARQRAADEEQNWRRLLDAGRQLQAYRLAAAGQTEAADLDALKQTAQTAFAELQGWPKPLLQSLRAEPDKSVSNDLSANEAALRTLCIRAELASGAPTPPHDLELRRQHQMQQLMQNMGQGAGLRSEQLEAMVQEWMAAGPVPAAAYAELSDRFAACRAHALAAARA